MTWQDNCHNAWSRQRERLMAFSLRHCRACSVQGGPRYFCGTHRLVLCARHWASHVTVAHDAWERAEKLDDTWVETIRL